MDPKTSIPSLVRGIAVSVLLAAAGHAGAADNGITDTSVKLGMSTPLSGPTGAYGRAMREGIETYFAQVNSRGGVAGRRLELVAIDDGYETRAAVENTKLLIDQERVFALMGFYGTSPTEAVIPVLESRRVPLVGTISGAEVLRKPASPYMFHLRASYNDETAEIVKSLTTLGMKRIAVFYQDDGFGQAGLKGVMQALEGHQLRPVAVASVPRNSVEVAEAVRTITQSDAQAVVMATLYRPTAEFVKRMRAAGGAAYLVALSPVGTDNLISELGPHYSRGIQVSQVIPHPWGDKLQVVRDYKKALAEHARHSQFSYYGLEGYMNARLMVEAMERVGRPLSRVKLMEAMRAAPFDLGGYQVRYKPGSNSGSSYVELSVVGQNGRILN